jgi:hypothetical protein
MAIKKKKVVEKTIEDIVEAPIEDTVKSVETPKEEVKQWTYDELVLLPRAEYLQVQADIKAGRAKVKQQ